MKQAGYTKRPYSRPLERPRPIHIRQSNKPSSNRLPSDEKIRGNLLQCVEKYLLLARDATSLGDPISAENYYQYADHYYRLFAASRISRPSYSEKRMEEGENISEDQTKSGHLSTLSKDLLK